MTPTSSSELVEGGIHPFELRCKPTVAPDRSRIFSEGYSGLVLSQVRLDNLNTFKVPIPSEPSMRASKLAVYNRKPGRFRKCTLSFAIYVLAES